MRTRLWYGALFVSLAGVLAGCSGASGSASSNGSGSGSGGGAMKAASAAAAPTGDPVTSAVRQILQRRSDNFTKSASYMPAAKYSYKPTKQQRTWGALMAHVAGSNAFFCSKLSGTQAPASAQVKADAGKDKISAALKASFDYCATALQKVNDGMLADSMDFFGGHKVTKATGLIELASDWADHYAQAAGYLRLNGILPPTARHGGM